MTPEITIVLLILAGAVVLFVTEKLSVDLVALLVLGALLVFRLVTPAEGLSGLSNSATVTVAAMFALSAGLQKTGAVSALGKLLVRLGKNPTPMLVVMMITVGVLSAFINNTATVAVFLPLVLSAAAAHKISSSKLLIPLSYASQFGGVCTLIGTSTNLLVSAIAERNGVAPFSIFEFSRLGLIMFVAGVLYILLIGRWLLPSRRGEQLTENFRLGDFITELRVMGESPLIEQTVGASELIKSADVTVLEILRDKRKIWEPLHEPICEGDVLLVRGPVKELMELRNRLKLEIEPEFKLKDENLKGDDLELVEALVSPQSQFAGQNLKDLDFHWRYRAIVLAMRRRGRTLRSKLAEVRLRFGDALLLLGPKIDIARLRGDSNLIVVEEREDISLFRGKAPLALLIIAAVVLLAALKILPIVVAALLGCVAMTLTRCLRLEDAYRAIDWKIIVLLAGILPLGIALEKSGAAHLIVDSTVGLLGESSPVVFLAALYLITAVLTECMSNNASAVLLAPIAISAAAKLGVSPAPFLIAVAFAASTSFATPVGYQTNTMVYNAGGYRFTDFMKVGIPLNLIFWALAVYFIPKFWPF